MLASPPVTLCLQISDFADQPRPCILHICQLTLKCSDVRFEVDDLALEFSVLLLQLADCGQQRRVFLGQVLSFSHLEGGAEGGGCWMGTANYALNVTRA